MHLRYYFFLVFIAFFIKIIALFYTNFDLFGDEAQYWAWSEKLDFGYYSKPPMLAWIIKGFVFVFGDSFFSLKSLPIATYFLSSYVVYLIVVELYKNKELGIIAGTSFYLLPAVSVSSFLISTDVFLIFFWSLSLLYLLKIRRNQNYINYLLLGIFLGISLLTKYAAIYFFLCLALFLFFEKEYRKLFFKKY